MTTFRLLRLIPILALAISCASKPADTGVSTEAAGATSPTEAQQKSCAAMAELAGKKGDTAGCVDAQKQLRRKK